MKSERRTSIPQKRHSDSGTNTVLRRDEKRSNTREVELLLKSFKDADPEVLLLAAKTFGGAKGAAHWLARAQYGLAGKTPLTHSKSRKGKAQVVALIHRIAYGVLA